MAQATVDKILLQKKEFKCKSKKEKNKLLEKILNGYIAINEDLLRQVEELKNRPPGKREKREPTPGQKKVQDNFGRRAQIASKLYNEEGATITWAEAMTLAGPLLDLSAQESSIEMKPAKEE